MEFGYLTSNRSWRYGLAIAVSIALLAIRAACSHFTGTEMPLQMLALAAVLAAGAGGLGPGLVATLLCAIAGYLVLSPPASSIQIGLRIGTFLLNGAGVSLIAEAMHRAVRRARGQQTALAAAEETARLQLAEIESTYRHAPVAMCVLDAELRWVRINEKMAEMNGLPAAAHLGRSIPELLPHLADAVLPALRQVLQTGEPILEQTVKGETPARPGMERTWVESWVPVKDATGKVIAIEVLAEEVTVQLAAEETLRASEERFRALVQASAHVVWTMNRGGGSDPAMRAWWRDFTGIDLGSVASATNFEWLEAVHPEDRSTLAAIFKAATAHPRPIASEFRVRARDGAYHWFSGRMVPRKAPSGELLEWVGTLRDVTVRKMAEASLRESEARFRAMFELASVGMSEMDFQTGRLIHFNERFRETTGYPAEELRALPVRLLTHPDDRAADEAVFRRATEGKESQYRHEKRYLRHNGEVVWVRVNASFLRDSSGRIVRSVAIVEDVTELRRTAEELERNHNRLRLALEAADAGTFEISLPAGNIEATAGVLRLYGFPEGTKPTLREFLERIHPEDRPTVREAIDRVAKETLGYSLEYRIVRPSGQVVWAASRAQPVLGPAGVVGLIGALLDATERMEAAQALTKAKELAEAASRAKDEFLAALSHELRTPLSPVLLLAGEGSANEDYPAGARADFAVIRKNIALEARLIDDLLDLTRITNGKLALEMENLDVHTVLLDALNTVRAEAEAKQQRLTVELQAPVSCVRGDPVRLQQVLWNLLRNAVKFTPREGNIRVATRTAGERLEIEIIDSGYGMTPRELATIFDAFAQGEHAGPGGSHLFGGLGLGLTITRMLVKLHAGEISAQSAGRGRGACLTVRLPLAACPAAAASPEQSAGPAVEEARLYRILLVEDHLPTRETLSRLLTRRGHAVLEAGNMAEGLKIMGAESFDVMISDIGLPDGDGCALMTALRAQHPEARGIAISGYGTDEDLARSARAGFSNHLTKPVEIGLIERALAALARS